MSSIDWVVGRLEIEMRPDGMVALRILGAASGEHNTPEGREALLDQASQAMYYERLNLMQIRRRVENVSRVKNFVSNLERIRGSKGESES